MFSATSCNIPATGAANTLQKTSTYKASHFSRAATTSFVIYRQTEDIHAKEAASWQGKMQKTSGSSSSAPSRATPGLREKSARNFPAWVSSWKSEKTMQKCITASIAAISSRSARRPPTGGRGSTSAVRSMRF